MSTGRIMTLSVQSLNKLYFQFLEKIIMPNLSSTVPQIAHLLRQRSAYEVHRYLEDLLVNQPNNQHTSTQSNASNSLNNSANLSVTPPATNQYQPYNFALPTTNDHHTKSVLNETPKTFQKSQEKTPEEKKNSANKIGLRRTLTGLAFQERALTFDFKKPRDDTQLANPISSKQGLPPMPNLVSIGSDFKIDFQVKDKTGGSGKLEGSIEQILSKGKMMKDWSRKISKIFNENQSKIEKYNKKLDIQNKLFSLNISTKIQKREEVPRMKEYQFQARTEYQPRKY